MSVKVAVIGHFGEGACLLNGQTVKTKIITEELQNQLGKSQVLKIDTHGGWKTLLKAPFQVFYALFRSKNVIILPAQNGLRVFAPLLWGHRLLFRSRKLHYVVIGGWLPQFVSKRRWLENTLKQFDGIYVETNTMKTALEDQGFGNVYVMPNCKKLKILTKEELVYPTGVPYKLCTFSRVMKEKGIETAVNAVKKVNEQLGYTAYTLDIYGQIDSAQTEWFEAVKSKFPVYVRYCGCVDPQQSVKVLRDYFALVFATHFYTEGIPGTIIDAYAAGIPVICARWESYADVIDEGATGLGYDLDCDWQLEAVLLEAVRKPENLICLKENCIYKAKRYTSEIGALILMERIDNE